jgi:hypothetical protein
MKFVVRGASRNGEYDLEGLLFRLEKAITVARLFAWLKHRAITTVVTAESTSELSRYGLGRSLSDCIVSLSMRVSNRIATRYLQVTKYRGSAHNPDEFPFLISGEGLSVLPLTCGTILTDGQLDRPATDGDGGRAEPADPHHQVPGHSSFQPGAGVPDHRNRNRSGGCIRGTLGDAHRSRAARANLERRVIGDLSVTGQVLRGLDIPRSLKPAAGAVESTTRNEPPKAQRG